jgi:tRNA A37 threonylcarbamoyladenosine synthetase subunit TsaC/SUA5/YrdC
MPGEALPLNDAQEIRERLEHQVGAVIDAGACSMEPTTVIDMSGESPEVLRRGQGDPARLGF